MTRPIRLALLLALAALVAPPTWGAARKREKKKDEEEQQAPDTVYIVKYVEKIVEREPERTPPPDLRDYDPQRTDSLLNDWYERRITDSYDRFFARYVQDSAVRADSLRPAGAPDDSVYVQRLQRIASPVRLTYNDIVRNYITRYTDTGSGTINRILSLAPYYFPMIEEELLRAGLPVELRALPIIESALSPTAVSHMGAAGLWQFMPSTGKLYGLEVNSLVDERYDPVLATRAACRYLKDMYAIFGDWSLSIAAYNCGPGNVNKALARAGASCRDFWDIYDFLPRETRGYVPAFIGASYAYAYHRQHAIDPDEPPLPLATDTVRVDRILHLGQVASTLELPIELLRRLNPQYRIDIIPATTRSYTLVLPRNYVTRYIQQEAEIRSKDSLYLKEYIDPAVVERKRAQTSEFVIHVVKSGETLGGIARRYHASQQTIMRDNNIRNANRLSIGQRLKIRRR